MSITTSSIMTQHLFKKTLKLCEGMIYYRDSV